MLFALQAIAVVFGFLITIALIIMLVFALKTRQKIGNYGKSNILWKKVKVIDEMEPPRDVEAWVSGGALQSPEVFRCSLKQLPDAPDTFSDTHPGPGNSINHLHLIWKLDLPGKKHSYFLIFTNKHHTNGYFLPVSL